MSTQKLVVYMNLTSKISHAPSQTVSRRPILAFQLGNKLSFNSGRLIFCNQIQIFSQFSRFCSSLLSRKLKTVSRMTYSCSRKRTIGLSSDCLRHWLLRGNIKLYKPLLVISEAIITALFFHEYSFACCKI